ncbi:MAG: ribosome assembly RNA-binding protein YhbY [Cardiobacteriaceae bacterium]|nr:ribosome assembly RNA-binding protein YhbY [Cardiobacteriaceae bacterium]
MLNKAQIRYLKALAHHLNPVVLMGAQGMNAGVDREIDRALNSHELIKVKLGNVEDEQQSAYIDHIVQQHQAEFVQKIGHTAIFYRKNAKEPKIVLPKK